MAATVQPWRATMSAKGLTTASLAQAAIRRPGDRPAAMIGFGAAGGSGLASTVTTPTPTSPAIAA